MKYSRTSPGLTSPSVGLNSQSQFRRKRCRSPVPSMRVQSLSGISQCFFALAGCAGAGSLGSGATRDAVDHQLERGDAEVILGQDLERQVAVGGAVDVLPRALDHDRRELVGLDDDLVFFQRGVVEAVGVGGLDAEAERILRRQVADRGGGVGAVGLDAPDRRACCCRLLAMTGKVTSFSGSRCLLNCTRSATFEPVTMNAGASPGRRCSGGCVRRRRGDGRLHPLDREPGHDLHRPAGRSHRRRRTSRPSASPRSRVDRRGIAAHSAPRIMYSFGTGPSSNW